MQYRKLVWLVVLLSLVLAFATGCKKDYLRDDPEDGEPSPGPRPPPRPGLK